MDNGVINVGDPVAHAWGFTSERWHERSYLFRNGNVIWLSALLVRVQRNGYLKELIAGIENDGLFVVIPCPIMAMPEVLPRIGFHQLTGSEPELWARLSRAPSSDVADKDRIAELTNAEALAKLFHDAYERQAKGAGWETQQSCRVEFDALPEANRHTMIATCQDVLAALTGSSAPTAAKTAEVVE